MGIIINTNIKPKVSDRLVWVALGVMLVLNVVDGLLMIWTVGSNFLFDSMAYIKASFFFFF